MSREESGALSPSGKAGATVYTAAVGAGLGSWSEAYPFVYALDFDGRAPDGTYHTVVTGTVAATSPDFRIEPAEGIRGRAGQRTELLPDRA